MTNYTVEVVIDDGASETSKLILRLRNMVARDYEDRFNTTPSLKHLRALALAIFSNNHFDKDPYELAMGNPGVPPEIIGNACIAIRYPLQPAWATYLGEAQRMLRALKDAEKFE